MTAKVMRTGTSPLMPPRAVAFMAAGCVRRTVSRLRRAAADEDYRLRDYGRARPRGEQADARRADVTFTALEDLTAATFELNNGLNITKLTDKTAQALNVRAADARTRRCGSLCRRRWRRARRRRFTLSMAGR